MSDANWMQDAVREFHVTMGQPAPNKFTMLNRDRSWLRLNLVREEYRELLSALGFFEDEHGDIREMDVDSDVCATVDAICDLLYVTIGTAVEMGVPLGRFFHEVHRSNMTKVGGEMRADGKILKPDTYKPPRISYLLERLKERGR